MSNVGRYRVLRAESKGSIDSRRLELRNRMQALGIGRFARGQHKQVCEKCAREDLLPAVISILQAFSTGAQHDTR
jgi:hypothetical protein